MPTIELTNEFHDTSANVRPVLIKEGRYKGYHKITRSTATKLRNKLCGNHECTCGGNFGERGGSYLYVVTEDWDRNFIVDLNQSNYG